MPEHHTHRVHTEDVVLDIGEGAGGLVFYTRDELQGREIEICPADQPTHKTHTEVDARVVNERTISVGVFPPLVAGDYRVCRPASRAGESFTVTDGRVTEIDWR